MRSVQTLKIAHRGVHSTHQDENTLAAHQRAATTATLDGSECDVRFDAEKILVVAHDENLLASRGKNVNVSAYPFRELPDTPTLESVVLLFADRPEKTLVIDYKTLPALTVQAVQTAELLAQNMNAACRIVHLVWNHEHNLAHMNLQYPVYFAPEQVANVAAHLDTLKNHAYTGVSLSYGQLVKSGNAVQLLGDIARAKLDVNLYGKLAHVEEMQRQLANHCPDVTTSVTVDCPMLEV